MKKHLIILTALVIVLSAVSCEKDWYKPFSEPDYSGTTLNEAISLETSAPLNGRYEVVQIELDQKKLKNAFGGTIPDGLVFYATNSDGVKSTYGKDNYTSEHGFYLTREGDVCHASSEGCALFVEYYDSSVSGFSKPIIGVGQYPDACAVGDKYTLNVGLTDSLVRQPFTITIEITGESEWNVYFQNSDPLTYTIYQTAKMDYSPTGVEIDEAALCEALGVTSSAKIVSGLTATPATISFYGLNADGSRYQAGSTANNYGHWFSGSGNVISWKGDDCSLYSEWNGATPMVFNVGQFIEGIEVGERFVIRQEFVSGSKSAILTFKLHIVDKITPDLGPDEE